MKPVVILALLLASAAFPARAQPALAACADERRTAEARIESCTQALRLALPDTARAEALRRRAAARLDVALARSAASPRGDLEASLPPATLDPALEDIEASLDLTPHGDALMTRAMIGLWRGDISRAARAAALRRDEAGLLAALSAAIAADPRSWEAVLLRGARRAMAGLPGAQEDMARARTLFFGPGY